MLSSAEVLTSLSGAWQVLLGRKQGLQQLDLSEDGFWRSFNAILVALPPMALAWIIVAGRLEEDSGRLSSVLRFAVLDLAQWLIPIVAFALVARPLGLSGRFVHFVVAGNWANVIFIWLRLPGVFLQMISSEGTAANLYAIALFVATLVLSWRLTKVTLDRDASTTTAIFLSLMTVSIVVVVVLQRLFGVEFG